MPIATEQDNRTASSRLNEASRVASEISQLCDKLGPGGRLPRHTELMRHLGASQYNIIRAIEDLQRMGRVVRRHGSGTYVTDGTAPKPPAAIAQLPEVGVFQNTIVAISRPDGGIFDRCIELLYDETKSLGLSLATHYAAPDTIANVDPASLGRPLGFLVFRHDLAPLAVQLQAAGNRVVIVGAPHIGQSFGVPCVCGNHERGGYILTQRLIELGHRSIAYLDPGGKLISHTRWQGHSKMLADAKRARINVLHSILEDDVVASWKRDADAAKRYFAAPNAPTAIVGWNDLDGLDILATLNRAGINVPGDVSVVGYDNLDAGTRVFPSLTTIDHFVRDQVTAAIQMLTFDQPASPNERLIFAPSLINRESAGPPRILEL